MIEYECFIGCVNFNCLLVMFCRVLVCLCVYMNCIYREYNDLMLIWLFVDGVE